MTERDDNLNHQHSLMRTGLEAIARGDCEYLDAPKDERPRPCDCPSCVARAALQVASEWRFQGALADRVRTMPRERKIVAAWRKQLEQAGADRALGLVLSDRQQAGANYVAVAAPSVRDWFVASSVVQWLATNVGMEVLRQAGWEYRGWDEDRPEVEARLRERVGETRR